MGNGANDWRARLRLFLAEHAERPRLDDPVEKLAWTRAWHGALADAGLAAPNWPPEVGGLDLTPAEQVEYHRLMTEAKAPPHPTPISFIVAPTLIVHGTPVQRERYLRPLLRADELWCQGFSEPGAGSDLTSLTTRAERVGDSYRVNGQKVWTTGGDRADWMFALVRTGPAGPGGAGITYLLIPMSAPGITMRPLRDLTGGKHFAEVFFDDVEVPVENRVGEEGEGWRIARTSLGHERTTAFLSTEYALRRQLGKVTELAVRTGAIEDALVRQELARAEASLRVLAANASRALNELLGGGDPGPLSSMNRLVRAEFEQQLYKLATRIEGPDAVLAGGRWVHGYLMTRASTIGAGTAEIQRNTIGEKVLGLPREPEPAR
jgi:alkylation response protein AidB-like acyl-CoA dehydrogenase